jgi:hypothetical protein
LVLTTSRCAAPCRTHLPACGHGAGLVAGVDVDVKGVALGLGINGADFVAPLTPEILSHLAAVAAVADAAADAAAIFANRSAIGGNASAAEIGNASATARAASLASAPPPPPYRFHEFEPPRLSSVTPRGGSLAGGLTVTEPLALILTLPLTLALTRTRTRTRT